MADYSRAGLAAAAGVDPWALHEQVRTGDPGALQGGALRLRRAGSLAADAAAGGARADRDLGAAFHNDRTAVFDAAASTGRGDLLLARRGEKIEETSRAVLDVAEGLSDTATRTASRVSDLDAELDEIIGLRNDVRATGPDPAAVAAALEAAEQRYFRMAVDAVRAAGGRVRADLDDYDALLRNRAARLEGLGYGAPAPAGPPGTARNAAEIPAPPPGAPDRGPLADLIALLAELGAAIASAVNGPGDPGAPPPPASGPTRPSRPPDPNAVPRGTPARVNPNDNGETKCGLQRENESARILAKAGYDVEQLPKSKLQNVKNPDYRIEGRIFDNYAPKRERVRNVGTEIQTKIEGNQTDRVVVNLADTPVTEQELRTQLHDYPVPGLKDTIVIDQQGRIVQTYP